MVHSKYTYLLNRFKDLEWSGPAWYKYRVDKDGYPTDFKLIHFHPLNLGSHAATEFTAADFAKIIATTYDKKPSLKTASIGLIHSHNTMGAFFSGTDTSTIEDMAPLDGFYPSLVVAKSGKATHAFGFGYQDQYKVHHCIEIDEDNIKINIPQSTPPEEWVEEADYIEKNKPKVKLGTQVGMWNAQFNNNGKTDKESILSKKTLEEQIKINKLIDKNSEGKLSDVDLEMKLESMGCSVTEVLCLTDCKDINAHYNHGGYNGFYY